MPFPKKFKPNIYSAPFLLNPLTMPHAAPDLVLSDWLALTMVTRLIIYAVHYNWWGSDWPLRKFENSVILRIRNSFGRMVRRLNSDLYWECIFCCTLFFTCAYPSQPDLLCTYRSVYGIPSRISKPRYWNKRTQVTTSPTSDNSLPLQGFHKFPIVLGHYPWLCRQPPV